jgi:Transposase DDE domain
VSFYPVSSRPAIAGVEVPGVDQGVVDRSGAVVVAVPVSALVWPVRAGSGGDGRSALVVAGSAPITAGEPVVWCTVVVTAPAVVRRDGRVQAQGRPCDHARLGAAEQELDRRCGPGTIDRIAAAVRPTGTKVKAVARREMSVAFTIRAVLLMTVMPDADHREVLSTLLGELTAVPWQRPHAVPSPTVLSTWRAAIGEAPLQQLQRELLAAVVAEHRNDAEHRDDAAARVEVGGGLRLGAIDGTVTRMPDTAANRAAFGTAGQAETGYPQLRHLHVSDALTRATLGVVCGPAGGDKGEAEQRLLDRMLAEQPQVFTPDRLWIMDRNFPGVPRIAALLATGSHALIRVKSDIRLPRISPFAEDGSYLTTLSGGGTTVTMRVVEYHVSVDGQTTPELFCLVTDLLEHTTHPAHLLAQAYRWRWDGSETALREAKSAIHDAGPGTGAILRSHHPKLIRQEHAAWIVGTELVRAATRSAAALAAPFQKGPRTGQPVAARHLSFTTARRTLIGTVRAGGATASLPALARAAAHQRALAVIATARVTTDRHRHRDHKIKSRQPFPHAPHGITTHTAPAHVHVCGTAA